MDVKSQSCFSTVMMKQFPKAALWFHGRNKIKTWVFQTSSAYGFPYLKHRGLGGSILIMSHYLCKHGSHLSFHKSESATWDWMTHLSFAISSFALMFLSLKMLKMKSNHKYGQMGNICAWLLLFKIFQVSFCCLFNCIACFLLLGYLDFYCRFYW